MSADNSAAAIACVLVVDDQDIVRETTQMTLETYGYKVFAAANGADAIDLFAAHQNEIDVLLTDMRMPQMSGATLIQSLLKTKPTLRIVATSGANIMGSDLDSMSKAKHGHLPKPFTAQMLNEAIQKVLQ